MAHYRRFALAIFAVLLAQFASEELFELVRQVSEAGLSGLKAGLPWRVLAIVPVVALCIWLRGGFYDRHAGLGRLSVFGLMALHYVGLAILHWRYSIAEVVSVLVAAGVLVILAWRFRGAGVQFSVAEKAVSRYQPTRGDEPEARPGLIVFLSFLSSPEFRAGSATHELVEHEPKETAGWGIYQKKIDGIVTAIKASKDFDLANVNLLAPFDRLNIRMPLEAIRLQMALLHLTDVAVIASCDAPQRVLQRGTGESQKPIPYTGSEGQLQFFESVCTELFERLVPQMPRIHHAPAADFEREDQISNSIRAARKILRERGAAQHYLDLTGGQAICSVVAAAQSLGEDDRCLYVSTRDYQPVSYNFVAETPPELG